MISFVSGGLKANGTTPMKDGLLMALQEIGKNGKRITADEAKLNIAS